MIGTRDIEYVEARLLAPSVPASEATERLTALGCAELAERVLQAQADLQDVCREVRREFVARARGRQ